MIRRLYSLLALLLVGSAGLRAQSSDPFPEVNPNKYVDNMTIRIISVLCIITHFDHFIGLYS